MTNPPQSKEYPELPEPDGYAGRDYYHRPATMMIAPDPANSRYTADHMRAYADATVAMRAQATVSRETVIEWLDANDIEVTDKQMDGLFHATVPQPPAVPRAQKFQLGDLVRKTSGSEWEGRIVGTYSTALTPEGYAVESSAHAGSVQIYPAKALEHIKGATDDN